MVFLQNRSAGSGLDLFHTSRSAAYLDYDNDGDLDVILNNYNGPAFLYENKSEDFGNNWLSIDLDSQSVGEINSTLIGTKVRITTSDGKSIWRQISSTTGYLSAHPKRIFIGLGQSEKCSVKITWPDGKMQQVEINEVNKHLVIEKSS